VRVRSSNRSRSVQALVATVVFAVVATVLPAAATPVCPDDKTLCGGRTFPEADNSIDFVQHDEGEYVAGLQALEEEHPKFVRVSPLSELLNDEDAVSFDGHEIWVVEITNFNVPERRKKPILASLSVHGPERAGLEGGVRYMEDLATWADEDPDHELRNGTHEDSTGISVSDALKKTHIYFANINPDGWEAGDTANGNNYVRGNGNGVDLNREFPTMGWTDQGYTPLSEPESKAWHKFTKRIDPVATTDIHGELTSANNSFADIMYPAGEWNPKEQAQEERLARHMKSNIERYFEIDSVELGDITGAGAMTPAQYATGYDVVGYDDSGFMGDYFTQSGALDMDVENFASHMFPGGTWFAPLEKAHIAAVRGQLETLIVEAIVTKSVNVKLPLGKVGYMFDPARIKSKDGYGGPPVPPPYKAKRYNVSRMKYFKDLGKVSKKRFRKVPSASVRKKGLRRLQTFVIANKSFPRDPKGRAIKRKRAVAKIRRFVKRGGNLVLTDKAIKLLPKLGVVDKGAIGQLLTNAGHVDIEDFEDPYTKGVHTTASQTYYEVPLGYPATNAAPHWTVDRTAWEEAGGVVVAHVSDDGGTEEDRVGLGRVKMGKGTIAIFAAVLPDPTEKNDHYYGLANYGVSVAGGQILNNAISYGRKGN
jgi:Zinc carboxypeptidase